MQMISVMTAMSKRIVPETIFDLAPGECAFVAPSALILMADRACHIQTDVSVRRTPDETASMQVTRTRGGYIADVTYCHHQWTPTDAADDVAHAPVIHVVFGDEFLQ
ncbi:MAG: hypothetical protein M3Y58_02035 [Chloroflexota bacterium]|nr:hypothetical protein [Chloroflexota bacterium]